MLAFLLIKIHFCGTFGFYHHMLHDLHIIFQQQKIIYDILALRSFSIVGSQFHAWLRNQGLGKSYIIAQERGLQDGQWLPVENRKMISRN